MSEASTQPAVRPVAAGYRNYAMGLLLLIYVMNFVDRQVVNILAEPIKRELGLLDWQVGAMSGLAFALFYTVLGLPIARAAERGHRPFIIAGALALWSLFTALCGFAQTFTQLLLARVGVGVGEAGCTPPAHSLIVDYVPKEKRASALAFYAMGTPLGSLVGLALGGLIADAYGWRAAFVVCGLPGVVLAIVVALTLIEPRIRATAEELRARSQSLRASQPFRETLATLRKKRTFWLVSFAAAIKAFIGYGQAPFAASFFYRNHLEETTRLGAMFGLEPGGFLGLALGLMAGIGGAIGSFAGGMIADKYGARDYRAYVSVPAIASIVVIPIFMFGVLSSSAVVALASLFLGSVIGTLWYGPVYATAQTIVPPHMRATSSAMLLFIINLIGLGLGPLVVGALSDMFAISFGMGEGEGVRWALIVAAMTGLIAAALFWLARKSIRDEMEG
ncbi:MAG: MFS transporter [Terricaulis sp.]